MTAADSRADIIAAMAKMLIKHNATANDRDAIRLLMGSGFRASDISTLVEAALRQARSDERAAIAAARAGAAAGTAVSP